MNQEDLMRIAEDMSGVPKTFVASTGVRNGEVISMKSPQQHLKDIIAERDKIKAKLTGINEAIYFYNRYGVK